MLIKKRYFSFHLNFLAFEKKPVFDSHNDVIFENQLILVMILFILWKTVSVKSLYH